MSADGRFIAFGSQVPFGASDTNGVMDAFVRDRATGKTEWVSVSSDGSQADGESGPGAISADGRFVAFESRATNLVAGDTNGAFDVFVRDRAAGTTERVAEKSDLAGMSADGRFVSLFSWASLVFGDTGGGDVFVRDRQSGSLERVSVAADGSVANGVSGSASVSADGRFVAFGSEASNLVAGDTNGVSDVFVRDRTLYPPPPSLTANWRFPFVSPFPSDDTLPVGNLIGWSTTAADRPDICLYVLEKSVDGGPFAVIDGMVSPTTRSEGHIIGHRYQYRVRAFDCFGRSSPYSTSPTFVPDAG